jgi:hypothetical protein
MTEMDAHISDLILTAGSNSALDRYRCGMIAGLRFLADWQPMFDREETEEDES